MSQVHSVTLRQSVVAAAIAFASFQQNRCVLERSILPEIEKDCVIRPFAGLYRGIREIVPLSTTFVA